MTVLIDPPRWPAHGRLWSHLVSDTSLDELHAFAAASGVPARGFEGDHYDVPEEHYHALVAAGAQEVGARELLARLVASGLRLPRRRGERVLASRADGRGGRVDTVLSSLVPPEPSDGALGLWRDDAGRVLLVADPRGGWAVPAYDPDVDGGGRPYGYVRERSAAGPRRHRSVVAVTGGGPGREGRWWTPSEAAYVLADADVVPLLRHLAGRS